MSRDDLRAELDEVVNDLNSRKWRDDDTYQYELGSHSSGPALDITREGEPPEKVIGQFGKAVMRAGYVVSATLYDTIDGATRLFLHDADRFSEHFDDSGDVPTVPLMASDALELAEGAKLEVAALDDTHVELDTETPMQSDEDPIGDIEDEARAEGFLAGLFVGTSVAAMSGDGTYFDIEERYPEVSRDIVFAPYGRGAKPYDADMDGVHHSIIDDEHYLWAYAGTDAADNLEAGKVTHNTGDEDDDLYERVTAGKLEGVDDDERALEYLYENNPHDEVPRRGGFVSANDEKEYSLYVYDPENECVDYDVPPGWSAMDAHKGVGFYRT